MVEARVQEPPHPVPAGAPHAVVQLPAGLRTDRPLDLVVFLHGWSGCARVLVRSGSVACARGRPPRTGWGLAEHHAAAQTPTVLIVPQLAFLQRTGDPGGFREPNAFRSFLEELLRGPLAAPLGGPRSVDDVGSVTLVAHSAGYETAGALIRAGGVDVDHVVLLDALYDDGARFGRWLLAGADRRLVSLVTSRGEPRRHTRALEAFIRARAGQAAVATVSAEELAPTIASHRMTTAESPHPHGEAPRRHLTAVLDALFPAIR